jgi:hypothetical protein
MAIARSGLQAAIALNPSLAGHHASSVPVAPAIDAAESWRTGPDLAVHLDDEAEAIRAPMMTIPQIWDSASVRLFDRLAEKEALGTANKSELDELENLSAMRRQSEMPRTGEEVLREYEQGQLVRNLLHSLTSYVEFEQGTTQSQGAARLRSKAKA